MRYMRTKAGTAHVVGADCPIVRRAKRTDEWKGIRSLKPEQVLDLKDCSKCESHRTAKAEIREYKKATGRIKSNRSKTATVAKEVKHTGEDKGRDLAEHHAQLAEENGWAVKTEHDEDLNRWVVTAKQEDCTAVVAWIAGKVDYPAVVAEFPGHTVWLVNTTKWRAQVSSPLDKRPAQSDKPGRRPPGDPKPVKAKKSKKSEPVETPDPEINGVEDEQAEFHMSMLPFPHDADDIEIIDHLRGKTLSWRNNLAVKVNKAKVPDNVRVIRLGETRTGRRFVSFPESHGWDAASASEVLGAERSVAIEDMIKVR